MIETNPGNLWTQFATCFQDLHEEELKSPARQERTKILEFFQPKKLKKVHL